MLNSFWVSPISFLFSCTHYTSLQLWLRRWVLKREEKKSQFIDDVVNSFPYPNLSIAKGIELLPLSLFFYLSFMPPMIWQVVLLSFRCLSLFFMFFSVIFWYCHFSPIPSPFICYLVSKRLLQHRSFCLSSKY